MGKIAKLRNNLFSTDALRVLGTSLYARYLLSAVRCARGIWKDRDLRTLDKRMGSNAGVFHYRGSSFYFDCSYCDQVIKEDSFAFGVVREIYIRDCYLKWHPPWVYSDAKVVVDLGANRGAFSSLMTTKAKFILSVECGEQYVPVIEHNFKKNSFQNYVVETVIVGEQIFSGGAALVAIDELLKRNGIDQIDLIKIDIEGSEFALFSEGDWLSRVAALSMEIHPDHGDVSFLLKRLTDFKFSYIMADENLKRVHDPKSASFLYAHKLS